MEGREGLPARVLGVTPLSTFRGPGLMGSPAETGCSKGQSPHQFAETAERLLEQISLDEGLETREELSSSDVESRVPPTLRSQSPSPDQCRCPGKGRFADS